jgi:hypothetical protein
MDLYQGTAALTKPARFEERGDLGTRGTAPPRKKFNQTGIDAEECG